MRRSLVVCSLIAAALALVRPNLAQGPNANPALLKAKVQNVPEIPSEPVTQLPQTSRRPRTKFMSAKSRTGECKGLLYTRLPRTSSGERCYGIGGTGCASERIGDRRNLCELCREGWRKNFTRRPLSCRDAAAWAGVVNWSVWNLDSIAISEVTL